MRSNRQALTFKAYLALIFILSLPATVSSLSRPGSFSTEWISLLLVSVFVATINVRIPKISSVISMGDVFVILSLLYFGPGPTLVMYWANIAVATFSDTVRNFGIRLRGRVIFHRFFFNLSCCALSVYAMDTFGKLPAYLIRENLVISLAMIALSWFLVNTVTLSLAVSLWMQKGFWTVW